MTVLSESLTDNNDMCPDFVKLASNKYINYWNSLTESEQIMIENQATLRTLDSTEKVNRFFESRVINFKQSHSSAVTVVQNGMMNEATAEYDPIINSMQRLRS